MVVDTNVQILPANTAALALAAALPGDPMAWAFEASELFDVDVQQFIGSDALAALRLAGRCSSGSARAAGAGVKSDHADPLNLPSDSAQAISSRSSHRPRRRWPPPSGSVLPPSHDARLPLDCGKPIPGRRPADENTTRVARSGPQRQAKRG